MEHPVELSFQQQLEDLIDHLDTDMASYGIAMCVLNDPNCSTDCLSGEQMRVWNAIIAPALKRQAQKRDQMWRKELMERGD